MPKFRERLQAKDVCREQASPTVWTGNLIAKRYKIQKKLGSGSFGMVYLIRDEKARTGEEEKVLKEISVGNLGPNDTVQAHQEAQLLSQLQHPNIVKFYSSFLEQDKFCIITEYCEGRDLDCKVEECKEAGRTFPEAQIIEWFIQLLLGVHYMHARRILHRDLKTKNVFLKNNVIKIGDFGVSCFLMGSCDLATTFTGTPYYMSPEALSHQGYDSKSDIWSLACILYEMCCLDHAFSGHNLLSVMMKIVNGKTPSLPERYSEELNTIMQSMLNKNPSLRLSAAEILRVKFIEDHLQSIKLKFSGMTLNCQNDSRHIINALQKKVHLQTLRDRSEVQKMTPRERMRLRKLQDADEKARKLKQLAEEKYQENHKRMQEFRSRNFQRVNIDVLNDSMNPAGKEFNQNQLLDVQGCKTLCVHRPSERQERDRLCMSEPSPREIPEDPEIAEQYYYEDGFESCSDESDEFETVNEETVYNTCEQDSDIQAMVQCMEDILDCGTQGAATVTRRAPAVPQGSRVINCTMAETKMKRMRESITQKMGPAVFHQVYDYLKDARQKHMKETEIKEFLSRIVERLSDCFEVDQLLYFEEQLELSKEKETTS
ncbi:serine/threonine-protein kinase Nek11 [Polypterus senegalus]|uniref:serine/threonine-protein kinase Nek11 n=1 Tax=Polypterus senegalus TaxID=55291 RepID=UPI0019642F50|nr:serine/threonine-protein kinase Nek11 [Polypterus senegalus]